MKVDLGAEIKDILYGYVRCNSLTGSVHEKHAEQFFLQYFRKLEYFKRHPEFCGAYPIPNDQYGRAAVYAMVKGRGNQTVVLIHHNDVVGVEDFKLLKDYAFSPDALYEKLGEIKASFSEEARKDYESGTYLFGRGVCDMKGGGAIQMALLAQYSMESDFEGNVIVLGVPDEENLSAGMRAGVELLAQLKERYSLEYRLMINSEPHQRKHPDQGIFSFGSIGKVMPYVYVRGCLAHAGKVFEGFNPANLMAEIVRRTEVQMDFSDVAGKETAPPPTWLYLREHKDAYDVSMPLTMRGCLSVLTLKQSAADVLEKLRGVCESAFQTVIDDMNRNYELFLKIRQQTDEKLLWNVKVVDFDTLFHEAKKNYGSVFLQNYQEKIKNLQTEILEEKESLITANFELVDFIYDYINDLSPRVVIGLMPPYYPNVANVLTYEGQDIQIRDLFEKLRCFAETEYHQVYTREDYYTGISDLSYSSIRNSDELEDSLKRQMPFFNSIYTLPVKAIESIAMPCVNIGPWGKDFHKLTERVLKEDLYERTPAILDYAIRLMIEGRTLQ